mmetsp:Transcript_84371/g.131762  ORF Transcript_84371/g.131762 Transcript_84371/m.131762 type:complete len:142 (+) Transcript_84371:250-675(+)
MPATDLVILACSGIAYTWVIVSCWIASSWSSCLAYWLSNLFGAVTCASLPRRTRIEKGMHFRRFPDMASMTLIVAKLGAVPGGMGRSTARLAVFPVSHKMDKWSAGMWRLMQQLDRVTPPRPQGYFSNSKSKAKVAADQIR